MTIFFIYQNDTAPGRFLEALNMWTDSKIHQTSIRRAFRHFLALVDFKFDYSCNRCGNCPAILLCDANWKACFDCPRKTFYSNLT